MPDTLTLLRRARRALVTADCASRRRAAGFVLFAAAVSAAMVGCGGSNPLDNPDNVLNPAGTGGRKLSFAYYQKCIHPIFIAPLQINQGGAVSINTCAASGCHDNATGTGGAFRLIGSAPTVDLAGTPDAIRATDMYKNFYSAQGEVVLNAPLSSRLLTKPLLLNVLHGGGLIFENDQDPNVKLIQYWISRPAPEGQDEFSTATYSMFTPPDPNVGTCNTQ
jgi:hypothetical protein